jgi:YggT family protein
VSTILHWIGRLLELYVIILFIRFVVDLVMSLSRSFRPTGGLVIAFEFVYTITDPPLRLLRRVIPPLNLGSVSLDLSFLLLFIVVQIVAGQLQAA